MRALLISTYDLGRQPLGLASPAAWLRRSGVAVDCVDTSREPLDDGRIRSASVVAFYLPMHTATRLAAPLIDRVRAVNPDARLCAYGLYASLNAEWLRARGVAAILGPEAEAELVEVVTSELPSPNAQRPTPDAQSPKPRFLQPDRAGLLPLDRYASLRMPDGTRRTIGSTDASRGCKHLCRHCPIVPVYRGRFRAVPIDVVLQDIRAQVAAGAQHISFGDPDFFNGPTHARRLVERLAREWPVLSYDVTIKIEHLLRHAELLPGLRQTGCVFVTSAVESIDDAVLAKLRKGHTRADFVRAVALCREAGLTLAPTFIPFTPWTTLERYVELLDLLDELAMVDHVAPVQLGIRLLVTAESPLLELPEIGDRVGAFDQGSLAWRWRHEDPRVDALQECVMRIVSAGAAQPRAAVFADIDAAAREQAGLPVAIRRRAPRMTVPYVSEPWYCCAEPMEHV
ncbi:MAG: radical SAM protein [Acidobacteria bacterium]|nr:radical SAM protein [Acidobacteriota bacterium]